MGLTSAEETKALVLDAFDTLFPACSTSFGAHRQPYAMKITALRWTATMCCCTGDSVAMDGPDHGSRAMFCEWKAAASQSIGMFCRTK